MKIIDLLAAAVVAFGLASAISVMVILGVLWSKGAFQDERFLGAMAALYGVRTEAAATSSAAPPAEQRSLREEQDRRMLVGLDIDLRESAIDKSLVDLRNLEADIRTERDRLDKWKLSFDKQLADLQSGKTDESLLELQRTLEAMSPKQAKDRIMDILDSTPRGAVDRPLNDIVTILKTMPLDKKKKLLAEFKTEAEAEQLNEVLAQIRLGLPDSELIRDTRDQMQQQLNPRLQGTGGTP
jgi:hypothetical protein